MPRKWSFFLACLFAIVAACAGERPPPQPVFSETPRAARLHFRYELADGKGALDADALQGRATVIAFITTYDLGSQAQARFLTRLSHAHTPRINAAIVVLEPPDNQPLVVAFRDALKLDYPVAMGDAALIAGDGPFGDVHAVPSTVVLDAEGRLVWRHVGLAKEDELERALSGL
jgi:hypothetical protein